MQNKEVKTLVSDQELDRMYNEYTDQHFKYKKMAIQICNEQYSNLKYCFDIYNVNQNVDYRTCKTVLHSYEKCIQTNERKFKDSRKQL